MNLQPFIVLTQNDNNLAVNPVASDTHENAIQALAQQLNSQGQGNVFIIGALSAGDVVQLQNAIDSVNEAIAALPEDGSLDNGSDE